MKSILNLLVVAVILIIASCSSDKKQPQSLAGKVYISSEGMDSACQSIPPATDFFQAFLFRNDSEFVQVIFTCCPESDEDFAYQYVSKGSYTLDENSLALRFDPKMAVLYMRNVVLASAADASSEIEHVELEESGKSNTTFKRKNCKEFPYFEITEGDFKGEFIAPVNDSLDTYREDLVKNGTWKKLFPN